jgi:sulfide:quinone oxidoreductase
MYYILNLVHNYSMKNIIIVGAGTAGTVMCHQLVKKLNAQDWKITVVDPSDLHYYQPGFLFIPFGIYKEADVIKKQVQFIPHSVGYLQKSVDRILPEKKCIVFLDGSEINYDILIIATGSQIAPSETAGLLDSGWRKNIFDFYTFDGSVALHKALKNWKGGKLVIHINEMPIKCPVAPLEFAFLADWWLVKNKLRNQTEIIFVTPMSGAFTKPKAAKAFEDLMKKKNIHVTADFATAKIDPVNNKIISWDDREVKYDMLVTVPTNMGSDVIARSNMGDELNFVPTHKHTLQSKKHNEIFVIGDATDLPASKAGSVVHFQSEILIENILKFMNGESLTEGFDGHANCFIETGYGKAFLIDFNYEQEPVEGTFPFSGFGPLQLLKESRMNHWGKLAFRWIYWKILLKAYKIPFVTSRMSLIGKQLSSINKEM